MDIAVAQGHLTTFQWLLRRIWRASNGRCSASGAPSCGEVALPKSHRGLFEASDVLRACRKPLSLGVMASIAH